MSPQGGSELLVERTVYGEALGSAAVTSNHRGRVYQHYDGAGVVTSVAHDFKGNLLQSARRLAREYRAQVDWTVTDALEAPDAIASAADGLLAAESFSTSTAYDALNRPTSLITPDQSEVLPTYNEASLLERVEVWIRGAQGKTTFVDDIDYDAKGQRERIAYGNGTTTTYTYDPETFRLVRLKTQRASDGAVLQNLRYTHDPVGNITAISDSAQQTVFFAKDVVTPSTAYVYDAIYRLIQATGREQAGGLIADAQRDQNDLPLMNLPHANDLQAVRRYAETYEYDAVGNILRMAHAAGNAMSNPGSWTRRYAYEEEEVSHTPRSNRLMGTSLPGDGETTFSARYTYDAHGNMTSMPHLGSIGWDHRDQMVSADKGGGGVVYFTYDAAGQRVRKVWEHNGLCEERIYLGRWEIYRKRQVSTGEVVLERETLHVMDGVNRIALVETKTADADVGGAFEPSTVSRFQMGNHLGSAVLEVDEAGLAISYEEYHPYGTTAYHAARSGVEVSAKRYRYTGKERDEETGLYYYGARYHAPWLGRWTAADPAEMVDGPGLYTYVRGNPLVLVDPSGTDGLTPRIGFRPIEERLAEDTPQLTLRPMPPSPTETFEDFLAQDKYQMHQQRWEAARNAAGKPDVPTTKGDSTINPGLKMMLTDPLIKAAATQWKTELEARRTFTTPSPLPLSKPTSEAEEKAIKHLGSDAVSFIQEQYGALSNVAGEYGIPKENLPILLGQMIVEMGLASPPEKRSPNLALGNYFSLQPTAKLASELGTMPGAGVEIANRGEAGGSKLTLSAVFGDAETMYRVQFEKVLGIGKLTPDGTREEVGGVVPFPSMGQALIEPHLSTEKFAAAADRAGYSTLKGHATTLPRFVESARQVVNMLHRKTP